MSEDHTLHCSCVPPSEVHTDAQAETDAVAEVAAADVQIAQIQGETAIKLAQIEAKQVDPERDAEIAALQDEVATLKALLAPPAPVADPAPAPIVVDAPVVADDPADELSPPDVEKPHEPKPRKSSSAGLGFW
jgi:hypothetical protein